MAKHLRLKVCYVSYFDDKTHGKLLPREKRILINANKPRTEHIYTMLHEIGHYLLHFKNPPKKHHPRVLDINWKIERLTKLCSKIRRMIRFQFNKVDGKEWEADLWAVCAFFYLAKHFGYWKDFLAFVKNHPEKKAIYCLTAYGAAQVELKARLGKPAKALLAAIKAI